MNLKEIAKILNDDNTLYFEQKECEIAVNKDIYIIKKYDSIYTGRFENLDDVINEISEPQNLIDINGIAESLGLTRQNINYHVRQKNYKAVPKPMFCYENKTYTKYLWSSEQFE